MKAENNDYQLAKDIIDTMDLYEQMYVPVTKLNNFRKYLREIVTKRKTTHQFDTRIDETNQLKIVRIR